MKDLLNCPNCGAPIEKDFCPYCGSVFLDWASFDVNKPTFVKIKDRFGRIVLMKLSIASLTEHFNCEPQYLYADNRVTYECMIPDYTFEAEFRARPFHHYLDPDRQVYEVLIDPKKADPETLKEFCSDIWEEAHGYVPPSQIAFEWR